MLPEQKQSLSLREEVTHQANKLVVVIDDATSVRKIIESALGREGYEVKSFSDGVDAIRWLTHPEAHIPDLILLDIGLPKMDGYEVAQRLKTNHRFQNTVITILSRRDGSLDRLKGRLAGAKDYLPKPFSHKNLIALINKHIGPPNNLLQDDQIRN